MDIEASQVAQLLVEALVAQGGVLVSGQPRPGGREAFVAVRMPTGQVFSVRIEEDF
jgi:hypothetical protein